MPLKTRYAILVSFLELAATQTPFKGILRRFLVTPFTFLNMFSQIQPNGSLNCSSTSIYCLNTTTVAYLTVQCSNVPTIITSTSVIYIHIFDWVRQWKWFSNLSAASSSSSAPTKFQAPVQGLQQRSHTETQIVFCSRNGALEILQPKIL